MSERRRYMRFNIFLEAVCRTGDVLKRLTVNNFSKEGIGILSGESFDEGENVEIEVLVPGDNVPVLLKGEIAWAGEPTSDSMQRRGGIRFKKIDNNDRGRILEHIYQEWIMPAGVNAK
ncbi:MAG: PilZ domain-containing protein [Candidatus Omnitrophota bacterium]